MRTLADLVRPLNLRCRQTLRGRHPPALVLVTDAERMPDPLPVAARLPAGSLVIFRHYGHPDRAAVGKTLADLCRRKRLSLLIAGDFALAVTLKTGLHLPEHLLRQPLSRQRLWSRQKPSSLLSVACHGRAAFRAAIEIGADMALLSPVFPTASHPDTRPLGNLRFRRLAEAAAVPLYALGGMNRRTVGRLAESGAAGIAAIGGFL